MGDLLVNASAAQTRRQEKERTQIGEHQGTPREVSIAFTSSSSCYTNGSRRRHCGITVHSFGIRHLPSTTARSVALHRSWGSGFCTAAIPSHSQPELRFLSLHRKTYGHDEAVLYVLFVRFLALWACIGQEGRRMHGSQPSVRFGYLSIPPVYIHSCLST